MAVLVLFFQHNLSITNETVNEKNFESAYLFLFILTFIYGDRASGRCVHNRAQLGSQLRPPTLQVMGRAMLAWRRAPGRRQTRPVMMRC